MIACAFAQPMWPRHGARQMPVNILPYAPSPFIPMIPLPRNQYGAWTGNTGFGGRLFPNTPSLSAGTQWSGQWTTGQNGQFGLNGQNGQFGLNGQNGQFGINGQNGLFGLNGLNGQFGQNAQNDQFGQNAQNDQFGQNAQNDPFGQNAQNDQFGQNTQNGQWIDGSTSGQNSQGNVINNDLNTGTSGDPWATYKQLNAGIDSNTLAQSGARLSQQVLGGQRLNNQLSTEQWPGFQQIGVNNNGFGNTVRQNSWTGSQNMNFPVIPNGQQTGSLNQRFGTGLVNNGIPNNQATWWKK
ncbi:N66 matrix protein-like [Mya arenaria]|uniref:N66 matrix protein-like n=1 Tax=Mya arenaria TaxID=6604 RepID=UPI0022DFA7B7|nr:N66 matrix protein-like [Mya arenaria]